MHCNCPFLIHKIYKASGNFTFCYHLFIVLQALEVAQKHYGEDSKELIPIYQCLARAESSQGDASSHERATKLFLQAHDISKLRYIFSISEIVFLFCVLLLGNDKLKNSSLP